MEPGTKVKISLTDGLPLFGQTGVIVKGKAGDHFLRVKMDKPKLWDYCAFPEMGIALFHANELEVLSDG